MPNADLVLEGGGVKGVALVGALDVLTEHGYRFNRVAGTSAGSIVGALVASGLPMRRIVEAMHTVDYTQFRDRSVKALIGHGLCKGDYLRDWLSDLLDEADVTYFTDIPVVDWAASANAAKYRLVVMASDLTHGTMVRLPWDYYMYGVDSDRVPIVDAVRASMSIPFFYRPVKLKGSWLVDGGLLSNFPVDIFDRDDDRAPRWPTFGIKLSGREGPGMIVNDVKGWVSLGVAVANTAMTAHDRAHVNRPETLARTMFVDTSGVSPLAFGMNRSTVARLYEAGREAAEKFLGSWDFTAYKELFR